MLKSLSTAVFGVLLAGNAVASEQMTMSQCQEMAKATTAAVRPPSMVEFYCVAGKSKEAALVSVIKGPGGLVASRDDRDVFVRGQCAKEGVRRNLKTKDMAYIFANFEVTISEDDCR
jgi:hypothetical protein